MVNIKQGAGGFKQNMDAAGHNILLRGFIKKKDKEDQIRNRLSENYATYCGIYVIPR